MKSWEPHIYNTVCLNERTGIIIGQTTKLKGDEPTELKSQRCKLFQLKPTLVLLSVLQPVHQDCHVVTRGSQAARTSCRVTLDSLLFLQFCLCFHTRQVLGRWASPLLIQCSLSLLLCRPRSLSKPVSVPCGPLYFPSVTVLSHHPCSFQSVRRNPKGFVSESCSLVLSGTYSLTPARSLSACVSRPFTPTQTQQNRHQH